MPSQTHFFSHYALFIFLLFVPRFTNGDDDYFFVGDLAQYTTNEVPTPVLRGSVIEVTAVGDPAENGILLLLSPDMETSLREVMDRRCAADIDTACYQAVLDLLDNPDTIIQTQNLQKRQSHYAWLGMAIIPDPLKIPPAQIEDSFNLEKASVIIVVTDDSTPMTVTQAPEQAEATGPPSVITTFASDGNGANAGDVGIQLDPLVASRLQLLLARPDTRNCDLVDYFFFDSDLLHVRDLDLNNVICGAQTILADEIEREGYPDWLLVNPARLPWTNAELVAGVNTVVRWALNTATRLNPTITGDNLRGLAVGAFALSWLYFNNGIISAGNIIPAASLRGGPSATQCPMQTAVKCGVECYVYPWAPQWDCTTACVTSRINTTATSTFSADKGQQIAIASYINPLADPAAWNRLIAYDPVKMPILVANVVNSPDSAVDLDWTDVITRGAASGRTVLGYVRTGYLGVSVQKFTTRLGLGNLADWTAQIEEDIDMWYNLYGNSIGGIFFDEGWPECGDNNQYVDLYKYINDYTKRRHPDALTVLNTGPPIASCYEDTMDTLLTFELSYNAYKNSYTPNDWRTKDPRKLWHIVYDVPESAVGEVVKLAKDRGAAFLQLTNDVLPNPYDTLPGESYVQSMMNAIEGCVPLNDLPSSWRSGGSAAAVSGLSVLTSNYSSAKLSWNAASNALGYYVYSGDNLIASVPGSMTTITVGGLKAGSTYMLHVSAVGGSGTLGSPSNSVTVSTKALPLGKTITNYASIPQADTTTFTADILVPYAFIRLDVWDSVGCEFDTNPGWSVNFKIDDGTLPEGSTAPPWSWTPVEPITLDVTGYTYTRTIPLGTSTINTGKFVVQAQEPGAYDCKGSSLCTTPGLLAWCDHAVNTLYRGDDGFYSTESGSLSGNCWGDQVRGCGVFIQGDGCRISGNDMWNAYQNIRDVGGCAKCGSFHRDDGCLVTINYVYSCDNHTQNTQSTSDEERPAAWSVLP
ncbi:Spherulation-specific family 4-domain-containing protein [Aspergillus germanicus]